MYFRGGLACSNGFVMTVEFSAFYAHVNARPGLQRITQMNREKWKNAEV